MLKINKFSASIFSSFGPRFGRVLGKFFWTQNASKTHKRDLGEKLTKHCVDAQISSFGLLAIVPTSSKNSLRTLLGEGFRLATRSTRPRKLLKRANMTLETANLAPRTANLVAKTANLAAKAAQLDAPRPFQTRPGASLSRPRAPKPLKNEMS